MSTDTDPIELAHQLLGCDAYRGPGETDICVQVGHDEPWTDRGCPVAVRFGSQVGAAAARAAAAEILVHADSFEAVFRQGMERAADQAEQFADRLDGGTPHQ